MAAVEYARLLTLVVQRSASTMVEAQPPLQPERGGIIVFLRIDVIKWLVVKRAYRSRSSSASELSTARKETACKKSRRTGHS